MPLVASLAEPGRSPLIGQLQQSEGRLESIDEDDLCIPFVVFLGLMRPFRESILVIVLLGVTVDNLSGSPMLLYVTVYFWLIFSVRMGLKVAQVETHFRLMALVTLGVLFEHIVLTVFLIFVEPTVEITYSRISALMLQLVWAALTGPLLVIIFEQLFRGTVERMGNLFVKHTDKTSHHSIDY